MEAVEERAVWRGPVSEANVASVVSWHTSAVDDNTQQDESSASKDFHHAENKFDLSVTSDSKVLNDYEGDEKWNDPGGVGNSVSTRPVIDDLARVSWDQAG